MSNKINQISSSKNYGETSLKDLVDQPYRYGFKTDVETEAFPKGLNEQIVILISQKRNEPSFLLEFRLRAYKAWINMSSPPGLWSFLATDMVLLPAGFLPDRYD